MSPLPSPGRLNVLANVVRKPMRQIFSEFHGVRPVGESYYGSGDVKYHLGTSYDRPTVSGKRVHLSLLANPSHLEARAGGGLCACVCVCLCHVCVCVFVFCVRCMCVFGWPVFVWCVCVCVCVFVCMYLRACG